MIHLGNISKIHGGTAPVVDAVIGGSPCQDLSIAGKRAGLAGERSGLYMEQIRVIREMREHDRANGRSGEFIRPRYMVWENVPGAFSSNHGKDFAAVLEEAVRVVEPEAPLCLYLKRDGPQADASWVTDGALLGVYSMHSFGESPRDGVESRLSQILEDNPHPKYYLSAKACLGILNRATRRGKDLPEALRKALEAQCFACKGTESTGQIPQDATEKDGKRANGIGYMDEQSPTLSSQRHDATVFFQPKSAMDENWEESDVKNALRAGESKSSHAVLCLNDQGGSVMDMSYDVSWTLRAQEHGHHPTVLDMSHACDVVRDCGGIAPSLQARMGTGGNQVPLTFQMRGFGDYCEGDVASSCKQRDFKGSTDPICAVDCRNSTENPNINGTLQAKESVGSSLNLNNVCRVNMAVRRLTPLECERLQGFPDGWTDIGEWVDSKGKKRQTTDSARYKALGNSIALPPWKWVLKRLCAQYERDATMASLFDGIGGFPLLWEQLNGKGSCLWASEIEEFPMAVTRKRFE